MGVGMAVDGLHVIGTAYECCNLGHVLYGRDIGIMEGVCLLLVW